MSLMPRPTAPMVGPGGVPTREWLDYLRGLAGSGDMAGIVKAIEKLQQQVAEIERTPAVAGDVQGIGAIRSLGLLSDGLVRLDLRELEDAGGGELVKIARDGYGRVAGTSAATTDDLDEGANNLYFTDARADARAAAAVAAHEAKSDPHPQYTTADEAAAAAPVQSVNGQTGDVVVPEALVMFGDYASRPAATAVPAGARYACTDVREEYLNDGSSWSLVFGAGELLAAAERTDPYVVTAGSPGVDVPGLTLTLISGERPLVISFGASLKVTGAAGDVGAVILNVDGVNRSQLLVPGLANFTGFSRDVLISDKPPGTVITAKITAFVTGGASLTVFGNPADKSFLYARNA